jgi:hypothetical protein
MLRRTEMRTAAFIGTALILVIAGVAFGQSLDVYWDANRYKGSTAAEQRAYLMGVMDAFEYAAYGTHSGEAVGKCISKSFGGNTSIKDVEAVVDPRLADSSKAELAAVSVIAVAVMERCKL